MNPIIISHREFEGDERSLSYRDIDYIELDVRRTVDGVLVICHNRSLKNRLRRLLVDTNTYDDLYKKTGRKLPKLDDVISKLAGKVKFNLDIKQYGMIEDLINVVRKYGIENDVMFDSNRPNELEELYKRLPKSSYAYGFNIRDRRGFSSYRIVMVVVFLAYFVLIPLWPRLVKFITKRQAFIPSASIYFRIVNKGIVKFFHDRKISVYVFPVNDRKNMRKMVELGVDGIKTSKPELLNKVVKNAKGLGGEY
jgi:glycerophosphoryl diester phosphodiesterase